MHSPPHDERTDLRRHLPAVLATAPTRVPPTQPSAQQDHPARVWFDGYRCDGCEAARPQQFADVMRALYKN
ncbi:hypothetical protein [Streptomyces sp. NPDC059943]|uniref:hypothetical protein n=1 Tax=Streptomyces sp. NPDC059943 TaxID=3347010 RepID=UPI0036560844